MKSAIEVQFLIITGEICAYALQLYLCPQSALASAQLESVTGEIFLLCARFVLCQLSTELSIVGVGIASDRSDGKLQ